jgi:putative hydrolase of the HAD superfamily
MNVLNANGYNRPSMVPVKAVLFDYGLVLSGPADPVAREAMQRILDIDQSSLQTAYWRHRDAYDRGVFSGAGYWQQVAADLERTLDGGRLAGLIRADNAMWTQPNRPMIEWAARLQRAGIKTGILSNLGDEMEAGIRAHFPWLADFTHYTFSHRLGIAKPDPDIYRHAAEGLAESPDNILFVDDKGKNIRAARDAGMIAVQYTGHAAFTQEMKRLGLDWLYL